MFTQNTALAVLIGVATGLGLALLVAGLVGWPRRPRDARSASETDRLRRLGRRSVIALAVGLVVGLASQWPALGLGAVVLVFFWNALFGGAASEKLAMRRVEALAMWTESLRDTIAGAVGLEQAIPASARGADPVLRENLNALLDRLRGRMPLAEALQFLADDLDDPSADLVIAALILNSKLRGPGLREVLGALAKSAREEVDMRQRVIAQRAGTRRSVQIIVGVVVAFVLGMALFNRNFVEPYGSPVGQLMLTVVLALFGLGFMWLRRLAKVESPGRFLLRHATGEQPPEAGRAHGRPGAADPSGTLRAGGR
ncbi:type II secretion system F family protein [Actinocrinis puniceicyclus]|uniref:Type II secretion system F family protein n=1 Tax=Actinocrinis puniceicyclus TaxID=977794 RepID=A0A8J7WLI8_9ACTN|nr:type II secretion system F family protein [Actinocrinis puniceicyclus]